MRITNHSWKIRIILFAYVLGGCSIHNYPELKANAGDNVFFSCVKAGPLSCEIPPEQNLATGACSHLRNCLEGRQVGELRIDQVLVCDTPMLSMTSELGAAAAVVTQLDVDDYPLHGAYLFVRFDDGWCPVDQLLEPTWNHGGYCQAQFQFRWQYRSVDSEVELYVVSERICYMSLDQEEIEASESDIAMSECKHSRYWLTDNKLTKQSEVTFESSCQAFQERQ